MGPQPHTSQSTTVDQGYESLCNGSRILVTSITQTAQVEGCGENITSDNKYPRFVNAGVEYAPLFAAAGAEIVALYDGDRPSDFKQTTVSQTESPYKGSRSYSMTYSDSPSLSADAGFINKDAAGCYSWDTDEIDTPASPRTIDVDSILGMQIEEKGTKRAEKTISIKMNEGTELTVGKYYR